MSGGGRGETGMPGQAPGRVLVPAAGREVASRREGGTGAVAVGALALGALAAGALAVSEPAAGPFASGRTVPRGDRVGEVRITGVTTVEPRLVRVRTHGAG